jgi:PAS domain S-box-containing protein
MADSSPRASLTIDPRLAERAGDAAPTFVVSDDGHEVLWANRAAGSLLEESTSAGVQIEAPLAAQLARLPVPRAGFKLMRLNLTHGCRPVAVTCRAERMDVGGRSAMLVVALDAPASAQRTDDAVPPEPKADAQDALPQAAESLKLPLHFHWRSDEAGRITQISPEFEDAVGQTGALVGASWDDLIAHHRLDPDDRLASALRARDTWSGLTVEWPLRDGLALPIELAALPIVDRERNFRGFRGFGIAHEKPRPREVNAASAAHEEPPPVDTDEPSGGDRDAAVLEPPGGPAHDAAVPVPEVEAGNAESTDFPVTPALGMPAPVLAFRLTGRPNLKPSEHSAFQQIARALGATLPTGTFMGAQGLEGEPDDAQGYARPDPDGDARQILDVLPQGLLVHRDGRPLFANRALLDLAHMHDIEELARTGVDGLIDARGGDGAGGSVWLRRADGQSVPVQAQLRGIRWSGEAATLTMVTTSAQGDLVLGESLRERELRAILDTATDGVIVMDGRGRIVSVNRSAEALFGYENAELEGRSFTLLLGTESHRSALDYLDGIRANGVASVMNDGREIVGTARRGGPIPLFMTLGRISEGENARFCAVLRDLTHYRKTEEELRAAKVKAERASSQKSAFLARVSHEIRTPLNAVLGFAELMMEERFGPLGNDRYRDYLRDIHESGAHIISLINDLLDLSKVEAGKLDMNFEGINLNELVAGTVSLMQPQANRSRIIIRTSLGPKLAPVMGDARSLKQIVLNLLSNAVKYTPAGGQVIISTAMTDLGQVVVRVRDTGPGMSDSELTTALEPFRQLSTSNAAGSTGLGLPLTKALVEANLARFIIQSAAGAGTLVEVVFPPSRVVAH